MLWRSWKFSNYSLLYYRFKTR